ncbi:MAG TPA: DUF2970 domain-containing protein [Burkholderiaceae bacterium]|jgi:hypothetical protein|nr:DUF2970 domain-containing protein [Burkholderiaceae bacterium]
MSEDLRSAVQRKGSWGRTLRAVAWSFFGVRKSADQERDLSDLNPLHVVVVGVAVAAVFVAVLVVLVRWVIGSGIAAG